MREDLIATWNIVKNLEKPEGFDDLIDEDHDGVGFLALTRRIATRAFSSIPKSPRFYVVNSTYSTVRALIHELQDRFGEPRTPFKPPV